jgi:glucose-1-phosphate adenylyltransferase
MILAGGKGERLYPLTRDRAKPAVPFGGIYRIIDFTLSNCVNSNMKQICILTQYRSLSLERHVQLGWNILCSKLDEFIHIVSAQQRIDESWYKGTADAVYQNLYTLQEVRPDLVLILSGDHLYKMDYNDLLAFHVDRGADLTVAAVEQPKERAIHFGVLEIEEDGRVAGFQEKPRQPKTIPEDPNTILASMGIYVFNTETMVMRLIEDAKEDSQHDFGKNIIPKMVRGKDRVYAFRFRQKGTDRPGYWRDVGTIEAYYEAHQDLLGEAPTLDLHDPTWPIFTHELTLPPAKLLPHHETNGVPDGLILDSLISNGCVIKAKGINRSVLSPNVLVGSGSKIEGSVIMERVQIGKDVRMRRTIVDKGSVIPDGLEVGFNLRRDKRLFNLSPSGIVVIPKDGIPP